MPDIVEKKMRCRHYKRKMVSIVCRKEALYYTYPEVTFSDFHKQISFESSRNHRQQGKQVLLGVNLDFYRGWVF